MNSASGDDAQFAQIDPILVERARAVMELAKRRRLSVVTAESCTSGLLAATLTETPDAAEWVHGGFVVYTAANKIAALGIPAGLIERAGAVSEAVARAMVEAALARSPAQVAVAITGVAGPSPDDDGNPVGRVHMAAARRGQATRHQKHEFGECGRREVCRRAVLAGLDLLQEVVS